MLVCGDALPRNLHWMLWCGSPAATASSRQLCYRCCCRCWCRSIPVLLTVLIPVLSLCCCHLCTANYRRSANCILPSILHLFAICRLTFTCLPPPPHPIPLGALTPTHGCPFYTTKEYVIWYSHFFFIKATLHHVSHPCFMWSTSHCSPPPPSLHPFVNTGLQPIVRQMGR